MRIEDLEALADRAKETGQSRVILVITRKSGPSGHKIRVKGMGLGEIANVQERNGMVETVAWFQLKDVLRYIGLVRASL